MRFNEESSLFAVERDKGLESIINNIYQSFAGQDIYKSLEEKGANFLYLIVKNHVFELFKDSAIEKYVFLLYNYYDLANRLIIFYNLPFGVNIYSLMTTL